MTGLKILAAAVLAAGLVGGCRGGAADRSPEPAEGSASHAVHGQRLYDVMRRIQLATSQDWPQELDGEYASPGPAARQAAFDEACRLAVALAEAAREIPQAVSSLDIPEVDRRSFQAQVETLHDQARGLEQAALIGNADAMQAALDRIGATCASCHARFRDYSGPLTDG